MFQFQPSSLLGFLVSSSWAFMFVGIYAHNAEMVGTAQAGLIWTAPAYAVFLAVAAWRNLRAAARG